MIHKVAGVSLPKWLVAGRLFGVSLRGCELLDLSEVGSSIVGQDGLQAVVEFPPNGSTVCDE